MVRLGCSVMVLPDTILLVGGRGSRIASLYPDIPKPLIEVQGRPFLEWLLLWLQHSGVRRVILAVGYRQEKIRTHFEKWAVSVQGLELVDSEEREPLGTGGATVNASRFVKTSESLVLNGDSICLVGIRDFVSKHRVAGLPVGMVCAEVTDVARFGVVDCYDKKVISFIEKGGCSGPGLINGGIYCIKTSILKSMINEKSSLEMDLLPAWVNQNLIYGHVTACPFLDIGTPESLKTAGTFLIKNQSLMLGRL